MYGILKFYVGTLFELCYGNLLCKITKSESVVADTIMLP